jgi:hypothetical protein
VLEYIYTASNANFFGFLFSASNKVVSNKSIINVPSWI